MWYTSKKYHVFKYSEVQVLTIKVNVSEHYPPRSKREGLLLEMHNILYPCSTGFDMYSPIVFTLRSKRNAACFYGN